MTKKKPGEISNEAALLLPKEQRHTRRQRALGRDWPRVFIPSPTISTDIYVCVHAHVYVFLYMLVRMHMRFRDAKYMYTEKKYMKSNYILAFTAIKVLLSRLYRYGIAVTTILVLLYCGFGPGKIQCTQSHDNILPWDYLWT